MTLISRLSCKRAGTRFNARGIDDDGNVANFVETETVFWSPSSVCFSYVQVRGSVPVFWEQVAGLIPGQQKISITRSAEATQPAFDKHFDNLELAYGAIHVVNLLSNEKPGELDLTNRYRHHISRSALNNTHEKESAHDHELLQLTDFDFHAETRAVGYESASIISQLISHSAEGFAYYLSEESDNSPRSGQNGGGQTIRRPFTILQQEGVFRTNCLDCLDRTNLIQTIVSKMALEAFLGHKRVTASQDFWIRHRSMWADNGDVGSSLFSTVYTAKPDFVPGSFTNLCGYWGVEVVLYTTWKDVACWRAGRCPEKRYAYVYQQLCR
jgi:hypothetical protein